MTKMMADFRLKDGSKPKYNLKRNKRSNYSENTVVVDHRKTVPLLMTKVIKVANMSSHKSSVPSFTTTAVDTWEKEATKPGMKYVKIRLNINQEKRELFQKWMYSSNYSYNKTIAAVRAGNPINFQDLRNKFVTANTKNTHPEYQRLDAAINTLRSLVN